MPAAPLDATTLARAPKVLLHDHLDGGLRPQTVLELADEVGYGELPADEPEALGRWFGEAAYSGSLERYLLTFAHTVGVMQRPEAVQRVALVLGIWCVAGLVLCVLTFRWQDRGTA